MFIPYPGNLDPLVISHAYELKLSGVNLSITCTDEGEFITVDNLQRIAILLGASGESSETYSTAANFVFDRLQAENRFDNMFEIVEPTGYGSPNRILGTLRITEMQLELRFNYLPAISILLEPRTLMAFVPADKALNVVKAIKEKYVEEMGKVLNRLPLTVGIVFADRRTPLPAILDAGRRMLKQPTQDDCWTVI